MQKNKEHDPDSALFGGISGLPGRRLAVYREMLCLARNRETALTSDQFSEIASIAARKAEPAAEAARIDGEARSCLENLNAAGEVPSDAAKSIVMSTFRIIA